jgi:hypothetical protein
MMNWMNKRKLAYFTLVAIPLVFVMTTKRMGEKSRFPASLKKKTLFLGIDGLSKSYFDYAQKKLGIFKQFPEASIHIAPFPSISDYSWNKIMRTTDLYGTKGRIKTYEATYFDASKNVTVNDSREYFRRIGQENHYYAGGFEIFFNPYIESFLYLPSKKLPLMELDQLKSEIISKSGNKFTSVLIASVDAIAHTQQKVEFLMRGLDTFFTDLIKQHKNLGIDLEIMIVSDHGQAHDFKLGDEPKEMRVAHVQKAIIDSGYNLKTSLHGNNDIVMPVLALGNYASVHFKDLSKRKKFSKKMSKYKWFEHAIYTQEKSKNKAKVFIQGDRGTGILHIKRLKEGYDFFYKSSGFDPLYIFSSLKEQHIKSTKAFESSKKDVFPDSFNRIADAVFEDESDFPDLILTMKPEYRIKGDLDQFVSMFRTHGSLHKTATNGVVVSSKINTLPTHIATKDVLKSLSLTPSDLFNDNLGKGLLSTIKKTLKESNRSTIDTGAGGYDSKRVFGLINRVVNYSQYVFDVNTMEVFKNLFKGDMENFSDPSSISPSIFDFDNADKVQILTPKDIAVILDMVIETPDWKMIEKNPDFIKLKSRVTADLKKLSKGKLDLAAPGGSLEDTIDKAAPYTHAAQTIVMKQYRMPFLFKRALSFPEFSEMKDNRRFHFANRLESTIAEAKDFETYFKDQSKVKTLFEEVFNERKIVEDIYPQKLQTLYNLDKIGDTTFVYVPGIYNSIFNNEIFGMGIDALKNNFGLRVMSAPVVSACDSNYNGSKILNFIKNDIKFREERGRSKQKYFLLGYSKGAVDALYALNSDKDFTKKNISGLLSIASPLNGAAILAKSDVPIMLLELLGSENIPAVCRSKNWASKTITPNSTNEFYKENSEGLADLTRYYSLTFESDIRDSHIWMQATKQIAQFQEPNDGVVSVSSSKFPASFSSVDLGTVKADHLAGIVASDFSQVALFESLAITLEKIGAFNEGTSKKWRKLAAYHSEYTPADQHRKNLGAVKETISAGGLFAKSLSSSKIKSIEKKIKSLLSGTIYNVNDFKLSREFFGEQLIVSYHKDSNDFAFSNIFELNVGKKISNEKDLVDFLLSEIQTSGKDLLISEKQAWRNYPISSRKKMKLPASSLSYLSDFRINLRNIDKMMKGSSVQPITPEKYPEGVNIIYDHQTPKYFREEYKFNYETSSSIGPDNNPKSGWISHLNSEGKVVAKLSSNNTSIRLTSYGMRFMPKDFKTMKLGLKVTNNVDGANVLYGGSGDDDSAFQVWYTIRINKAGVDRTKFDKEAEALIYGYYWGDKIKGKTLVDSEIYENYYSKKNFIVAVLPPAKQFLIGHKDEDLGKYNDYTFDLYGHLQKAFPKHNVDEMEIVGITIQHDSNDTKNDSESFFSYLKFEK